MGLPQVVLELSLDDVYQMQAGRPLVIRAHTATAVHVEMYMTGVPGLGGKAQALLFKEVGEVAIVAAPRGEAIDWNAIAKQQKVGR